MARTKMRFLIMAVLSTSSILLEVVEGQYSALITPMDMYRSDLDSAMLAAAASKCQGDGGKYVHEFDCKVYFECVMVGGRWRGSPHTCEPAGATFDDDTKKCVDLYGYCPNQEVIHPLVGKCREADDKHVVPDDCSRYIRCHYYNGNYYPEPLQCGGSQNFDDLDGQKQCVDGDCPQHLIALPEGPGWSCSQVGDFNVLPTDCSNFYKCMRCSKNPFGWCYKVLSCISGYTYDDTLKSCVEGPCPQDLLELPGGPGWQCENQGDINVNPENCGESYECLLCSKPRGWCYIPTPCPDRQLFDDIVKRCIPAKICPQDLTPLPSGPGWNCAVDGEVNVHPDHCNEFYTCIACSMAGGWCYVQTACPTGTNFDEITDKCVGGVCPQILTPILVGGDLQCSSPGEKNVDPADCSGYYECHPCSHPGGWCYLSHLCPSGENFDDDTQVCVASPCPQTIDELPGPPWHCEHNGQNNVHPEDCTIYYTCYQCSKPKGWCYALTPCPSGTNFDEITGQCVGGICPQLLVPIPPGGNRECSTPGQKNVDPEDCGAYYECHPCSHPGGWCYLPLPCSGGQLFDDIVKQCIPAKICPQDLTPLPTGPGWQCAVDGELNVHPENCNEFYTCIACSMAGGWCYFQTACPAGTNFDEITDQCVGGVCPQILIQIPTGGNMQCSTPGEKNVDPVDCSAYYECHPCSHPGGWCYLPYTCPSGQNFDDEAQICVATPCPQTLLELPGPPWHCEQNGENNVHPDDCSTYFTCYQCSKPRGWCYVPTTCPAGTNFDELTDQCVGGVCPQILIQIPPGGNMQCSTPGEKNVDPVDCSAYYECHPCNHPGGWCYLPYTCPSGENFDDDAQVCVDTPCPQTLLEIPGPPWHCEHNGQRNVHPEDCTIYYTCYKCSRPRGWCYVQTNCPNDGFYNDDTDTCGDWDYCPQRPPPPPPQPPSVIRPPAPAPSPPSGGGSFTCTGWGSYPDYNSCHWYWFCKCLFKICLKFHKPCWFGKYYDRSSGFCRFGTCPYDKSSSSGSGSGGSGSGTHYFLVDGR